MTKVPSIVEAIYLSKSFAPHLLDLFDLHHSDWKDLGTLGQFATFWRDDPQSLCGFITKSDPACPFHEVAQKWLDFLRCIEPHCNPQDFEKVATICTNLFVFRDSNSQIHDVKEYLDYTISHPKIHKNILAYLWIFNPLNEPSKQHIFDWMRQRHPEQTILQSLIDLYNLGSNHTKLYSPSVENKKLDRHVEELLPFIPPGIISSVENTAQLAAENLLFARWLSEQQQNLFLQVVDKNLTDSKDCPRKM